MLASFDAVLSALLEDLDERGLLEITAVFAHGEMGRTPGWFGKSGGYGRNHWAGAQFVLVAGGGFKAGQVVGATDAEIASLGKTLYHLLGLDPEHELYTTDDRPLKLITEEAPLIREVL